MSLRPLYLEAGTPWQVKLDAGVALHVSAAGRARSLYPLQRLARVVCGAAAQWDTAALLACLRAGVPVLFHDGHGDPIAWCFGPRRRETTLQQLLREGLDHVHWVEHFSRWQHAAQRREVLAALQFVGACAPQLDAATARSRLCNLHRDRTGLPAGPWLHALHRALSAVVAENLHEALADPALIGYARPGLHLGQVFTELLQWRMHRLLHATAAATFTATTPGRFAAAAIERNGARLQGACGELLGDLEHQLRSWLL